MKAASRADGRSTSSPWTEHSGVRDESLCETIRATGTYVKDAAVFGENVSDGSQQDTVRVDLHGGIFVPHLESLETENSHQPSTKRPSRMKRDRSHIPDSPGSWVTITTVCP